MEIAEIWLKQFQRTLELPSAMNCFQWLFSSGTTEIIRPSKSNDGKRLLVPKVPQMRLRLENSCMHVEVVK